MLYNVNDINRKIDKQFMPQEVLGLGVAQANSSLFEPAVLVYLSRQHQKSDSFDRYAWLEWKSGAYRTAWWS